MPRRARSKNARDYSRSVFINCPFDRDYDAIFYPLVFTIIHCGFLARCALEIDDSSQVRMDKIFNIVDECRFGVHDLCRTELDKRNRLPRFNMPLELGVFLGAKRFGNGNHNAKRCLILDRAPYRYQMFISDIAGQDIRSHGMSPGRVVSCIRDWLRNASRINLPGGAAINGNYRKFRGKLPALCKRLQLELHELTFNDYVNIATEWLKSEQERRSRR
jgi:hypothetical protein